MPRGPEERRVAVTGVGAVTPLGVTMDATWAGIRAGRCPAGPITQFDATRFPTTFAYEVPETFDLAVAGLTDRELKYLNRAARFGCGATAEALQQAAILGRDSADERVAVVLGVGTGSTDFAWHERVLLPKRFADDAVTEIYSHFPNHLSAVVARMARAKGPVTTIHTACASSGQAVGEAYELIAHDEADVVVTGGADAMIVPFYLAGFSLLGALSRRNDAPSTASRPFAPDRDGFVMGEGAAILVLESYGHARRRGALILGEVCGYGVTESAYRITDLHPEGQGPIEAMRMALDDAGLAPEEVGYVNAHGTSTQLNDRIEALAISRVFPHGSMRVSSTKSMTGHMIAAAGAVELAICLRALREQVLPPSINGGAPDPECPVRLTEPVEAAATFDYALSNSVGFGGSNTAIIAGRGVS